METISCDKYHYDSCVRMSSIILSVICLIPVNLLIIFFIHNHKDTDLILKTYAVFNSKQIDAFIPEQAERIQYLASILLFPVFCFAFFQLFNKALIKIRNIKTLYLWLVIFSFISVGILPMLCIRETYFYISKCIFIRHTWVSLIFFLVILALLWINTKNETNVPFQKLLSWTIGIISISFILITASIFIFGSEYEPYITGSRGYSYHFNAYFYPVVQVFFGKTLLVDFTDLYGFYPYFLEPIFKVIGLSAFNFSIVMAVLLGVSLLCIYITLRKIVSNKIIAFCGFASIVFFPRIFPIVKLRYDPYFQYIPHRLIFPSVFILLAYNYFLARKTGLKELLYHLTFILCAASIFWNLDTGIIIYATWLMVLVYRETIYIKDAGYNKSIRRCFAHLGYAAAYLLLSLSIFVLYIYVRSGNVPNLFGAFQSIGAFYGYGFAMLPMKLIHPWNLVVLCYALGLYESIRLIGIGSNNAGNEKSARSKEALVFLLSILGLGLFSYYQGRSHDYNLIAVWWPAFMLLSIYVDDIYFRVSSYFQITKGRKRWLGRLLNDIGVSLIIFLALFFFLSSSIGSIFGNYRPILKLFKEKWKLSQKTESTSIGRNVDFINSNTNHGEEVFIISEAAAMYHLKSQTAIPAKVFLNFTPGALLKSEYENIVAYIKKAQNKKIFLDRSDFSYYRDYPLTEILFEYCTPVATSKDGDMILFEGKKISGQEK